MNINKNSFFFRFENWQSYKDTIQFGKTDYFIGANNYNRSSFTRYSINDSIIKEFKYEFKSQLIHEISHKGINNLLSTDMRIDQPKRLFQVHPSNDLYDNDVTLLYFEKGELKLVVIYNVLNSSLNKLPKFDKLNTILENCIKLEKISNENSN